MFKKLIYLISCALLLSAASGIQAAVLEISPDAPVPGAMDIANFVGALTDADNVGTEDDENNPPYWNDWCTYVAHDRGGQGQTFITGDSDVIMTGVWVKHVTYSGADPDQTWYRMQAGAELEIRITDPAAAGTDAFVLASETYVVTGSEENALPADTKNDQTGTSLWLNITLDIPVALAANTEYGFDLTSLSGKAGIMFFETDGINDRVEGGNPYEAGTAYTSGVNPDDHGDDLNGANDNNMVVAPGDHVFVVELETAAVVAPVHSYTFEDGTANDSIGLAHGTLVGDAAIVDGSLVLDGDGDWMEMPGEVIAMNTYSEVTVETWFTSVAGGNTGFHMLAAFGEEGTGANTGFGYKYLFITPARGDDVSRAAIQTSSMDDSPWSEETGVSAAVEHDDGLQHHFVATVDATNITFYIDGELIGSESLAAGNEIAGIGQAVAYLGKGVYPVDPLWTGSVQELNIYDRALSLAQVKSNHAAGPVKPLVHSWTFEDGTANDSVGSANGTLIGDATVVNGSLILDGDGDWMEMPGDVIAINTFKELTIEIMFTSVAGGNTGFHMVTAFGEEGTGENPGFGYKYICITPARGDDVSRAMIQTVSMDNDPWSEETGVSDIIEHDDGLPHHMVCTVDDTEIAFYIDGVLIGTAALDPPGNSIAGLGTDVARIGKGVYGVDPLWAGSVEELNIYNRALSLAEVQANFAAGPQKEGPVPVDPGTNGLMMHLPLDTASRGTTKDNSGNGLDGTVVGDPTFVEGIDILAISLDGVDDYLDCGNSDLLNFGTGDWTMSAWIKTAQSGTGDENKGTIFANGGDQSGGIRYTLAVSETEEGRVTLTTDDDTTKVQATSSVAVNDDVWHHVVGMRSGTDLLVYVDGVLDGSNTVPDGYDLSGTSQHNAYVGVITDNRDGSLIKFYNGLIDDVKVYNRALSTLEILFLAGM